MRYYRVKLFICIFFVAVSFVCFMGYPEKKTMPQPEFPLTEAELKAALEETGLFWSIEQADELTDGKTVAITYVLKLPEMREGYNSVSINSYDSEELGRRLYITYHEPQNKQWWLEDDDACWEDWKEVLELIARLYGGLKDAEEIYRVCSVEKMQKDAYVLWEGTLTGGYFRMETYNPMKPERFKLGNTVRFNFYESEAVYLQERQMFEKNREN